MDTKYIDFTPITIELALDISKTFGIEKEEIIKDIFTHYKLNKAKLIEDILSDFFMESICTYSIINDWNTSKEVVSLTPEFNCVGLFMENCIDFMEYYRNDFSYEKVLLLERLDYICKLIESTSDKNYQKELEDEYNRIILCNASRFLIEVGEILSKNLVVTKESILDYIENKYLDEKINELQYIKKYFIKKDEI